MRRRVALLTLMMAALVGLVMVVVFARSLPNWCRSSGGDVLIVVPIYCAAAIARPRWRPSWIALGTFAFAAIVECSQLYHAPAIDAFRATFVGRMTIGSEFVGSDFGCYAASVVIAFGFDLLVARLVNHGSRSNRLMT